MQKATTVYQVSEKTYIADLSVLTAIITFHSITVGNLKVMVRIKVRVQVGFSTRCTSADLVYCSCVLHSAFCKFHPPIINVLLILLQNLHMDQLVESPTLNSPGIREISEGFQRFVVIFQTKITASGDFQRSRLVKFKDLGVCLNLLCINVLNQRVPVIRLLVQINIWEAVLSRGVEETVIVSSF